MVRLHRLHNCTMHGALVAKRGAWALGRMASARLSTPVACIPLNKLINAVTRRAFLAESQHTAFPKAVCGMSLDHYDSEHMAAPKVSDKQALSFWGSVYFGNGRYHWPHSMALPEEYRLVREQVLCLNTRSRRA